MFPTHWLALTIVKFVWNDTPSVVLEKLKNGMWSATAAQKAMDRADTKIRRRGGYSKVWTRAKMKEVLGLLELRRIGKTLKPARCDIGSPDSLNCYYTHSDELRVYLIILLPGKRSSN
jgi:hypothetical protein